MKTIKLTADKYSSITVRLKNSLINEIETVAKNAGKLLGQEISRNAIIDDMMAHAKEEATFDINGKVYTFDELLHLYNEDHSIQGNDSNRETEVEL